MELVFEIEVAVSTGFWFMLFKSFTEQFGCSCMGKVNIGESS